MNRRNFIKNIFLALGSLLAFGHLPYNPPANFSKALSHDLAARMSAGYIMRRSDWQAIYGSMGAEELRNAMGTWAG